MAKARKCKSRRLIFGAKGLTESAGVGRLLDDVRRLIDETKRQVARIVNLAMAWLSWQSGNRVREDTLHEQPAKDGEEIVSSLMRQFSWTHLIYLIPLDDPLKRDFYAEMCRLERWSVRTLRKKIGGMLSARTALPKKPNHSPHCRRPISFHYAGSGNPADILHP